MAEERSEVEYTLTASCGHVRVHGLDGTPEDRERKAAWLRSHVCYLCLRRGGERKP
jgi:hypothetical protein